MKSKINPNYIANLAKDKLTYELGGRIYSKGNVMSMEPQFEEGIVIATVRDGGDKHTVTLVPDSDEGMESMRCTCERGRFSKEVCEHVVAALLSMEFNVAQPGMFTDDAPVQLLYNIIPFDKEKKTAKMMDLNSLKYQPMYAFGRMNIDEIGLEKNKTIHLEVSLQFEADSYSKKKSRLCSCSMRIGANKLYSVKSLNAFFDAKAAQNPVSYGKDFMYNPTIHCFSHSDSAILDMFESIVAINNQYRINYIADFGTTKLVNGKSINLTHDSAIKQLFGLLKYKNFALSIIDKDIEVINQDQMGIDESPIELPFAVERVEGNGVHPYYRFLCEEEQLPYPLTNDFEYVYYMDKVTRLVERQRKTLAETYKLMSMQNSGLTIPEEQKIHFIQTVYPVMKTLGRIRLDQSLKDQIIEAPLVSKVYFDRSSKGIRCRIEFHYGDVVIDPLTTSRTEPLLVRDKAKENAVKALLKGFKVSDDYYLLENDHSIYDFLENELKQLSKVSEVYYSEDFKNIKRPFPKVKTRIQLMGGSMLDITFETGDLDKRELSHLFKALRQKKKYYRLKNGQFMDLEDESLIAFNELSERLYLGDADFAKDHLTLPMNRALLIEDFFEANGEEGVERSYDYQSFVENMQQMTAPDIVLPKRYETILRDYQKQGFLWLKTLAHYRLGGILADDMGLGKTLQAIAFIDSSYESFEKPSLIVAPTSLIYNWEDEVKKFAPHLKVLVVTGSKDEREEALNFDKSYHLVITSYPLIRRDIEIYKQTEFAYCLLDEAQHIKNALSKTAETVKQIRAEGYFALTGTPVENNLTELWSLFDFVMPGFLGNLNHFIYTFEKPIIEQQTRVLQRLKKQIKPFILRRMKKDVLKELPPKIETKAVAHMNEEQKKVYMAYLEEIRSSLAKDLATDGFGKSQIKILSYLTRLRQICCHPSTFIDNYDYGSGKLDLLIEILEDALNAEHKILIFSQFTSMLDIIASHLETNDISYSYLDGSVKAMHRKEMIHAFNTGNTSVFLISLKAGGTGLNLTSADVVIHYDPWWNPAVEDQATDRAYRIGQENTVQVFKLITQGTIEEKIFELQQAKKEMIASVIEPGETLIHKLTEAEIKALFT